MDLTGPDSTSAEALLARVGDRVRRARDLRGLPRRVLSDRSGVSPRYLAQLEAGEGNISIALLHRVASALGTSLAALIADEDPWTSDTARLADLIRNAPPSLRAQALAVLGAGPARAQRICLIGLRGAGKSTLGAALGRALDLPFVELNREIEALAGMPVTEVMALYGPEGYRRLEAQALTRTLAQPRLILAVAGGIVADADTFATLLARFHTVWVKAAPAEHMARVRAQGDTRPMAGNPEAMDQLRSILTSREALYARAEAQLDTSGRSVDQSLADLTALVAAHRFLD